jgi:hypothetical protein
MFSKLSIFIIGNYPLDNHGAVDDDEFERIFYTYKSRATKVEP